jgi:hypothetical protein
LYDSNSGEYVLPDGTPCPNTIVSAVPFLRITPDARSGAMGDGGIALSPDANSMHLNSSKLAFADQKVSLAATYTPWLSALGLQDVYIAYLSGFSKLDDLQAIGGSLRYFSLGSIAFTDPNGQPLGTGRPNEFEIAGSYARKLSDNFSAALTAKFIYSNLAAGQRVNGTGEEIEAGLAGAADISFTYQKEYDSGLLRIGGAVTNVGSKITYTNSVNRDFLPSNLGIGGAYEMQLDDYNKITFALDINKALVPTPCLDGCDEDGDGDPDYKSKSPVSAAFSSFGDYNDELGVKEEFRELMYSFGLEYWYDEQFAVRAGYYSEHQTKGNRRYLTVGLGLKYNVFGLNFSYLVPTTNQRNPLDNTLRFSLLFDFGGGEVVEE